MTTTSTSLPGDDPLVSIILPVRHWRSSTETAVRSILKQSHTHLDVLLIGQKNTDHLTEQLERVNIHDKRIRIIGSDAPGIVGALNCGLANAHGDYIARMDDDDIAYADRIEQQLHYLYKHPHISLCAACVRFIDKHGNCDGVKAGNQHYAQWLNNLTCPDDIAHACYAENPMPHPTLLAHRQVWARLGQYREVDGPEDHDLVLRAMLKGMRMGKPSSIVFDWREHAQRITHTDPRYRRDAFVSRSAWALTQPGGALNVEKQSVWIAGTGKQARNWHDALVAQHVPVAGFVDMSRPGPERSKRTLPVITYPQLASLRKNELIISAVTQASARRAVREFCAAQCWQEGIDFVIGC